MKNVFSRLMLATAIVAVTTSSCSTGASMLKSGSSLMGALGGNSSLSTMSSLLQTPGLGKLLGPAMKGPFTLLAPSNDALAKLGAGALGNLTNPANVGQLAGVLKNHIVPGKMDPTALLKGGLSSAGGSALNLGGINMGKMISDKNFNIIPIDGILK